MEFKYSAEVIDVYDGDTITVNIDLGFYVHLHKQKFRLLYVDAPEIRGLSREHGIISRDALRNKILGKTIIIKTYKDSKDKYGRWLCEVWLENENINKWIIENHFATEYSEDLKLLK